MHCLNIVRCMIVYLDCINIMRFQNKKLLLLFIMSIVEQSDQTRFVHNLFVSSHLHCFTLESWICR